MRVDVYGRPLCRARKPEGRWGMRSPAKIDRTDGRLVHHTDDEMRTKMLESMVADEGFDEVDAILAIEAGWIDHTWTDTGEPVSYVYAEHRGLPDMPARD